MATKIRPNAYLDPVSDIRSRYRLTKLYVDDAVKLGTKRFSTWVAPEIDMSTYLRYTVMKADIGRLDNIAYKFYNDPTLWWVIAYLNNIGNMLEDMTEGQTLYIPPIEEVMRSLSSV